MSSDSSFNSTKCHGRTKTSPGNSRVTPTRLRTTVMSATWTYPTRYQILPFLRNIQVPKPLAVAAASAPFKMWPLSEAIC